MENKDRLQVGIDIGKSKADYALLKPNGQPLEMHCGFDNSLAGFEQAREWLLKTLTEQQLSGIDLAMEATSYYWLPLSIQFLQDPQLAAFQPRLALLNAGWVKWFKKSFPPQGKSDRSDPYYIGERLRTLLKPTWWSFDARWLTLRFYTRLRFHLNHSLMREKAHYQLFLFLAYTSYCQQKPFSDPFGQCSQYLLGHPQELASLLDLPLEDLAEGLDELAQHHLPDPQKTAQRLQAVLHYSYPLPQALQPPIQCALDSLAKLVAVVEELLHSVDQAIAALVQTDYPEVAWLDSIPGIGPVFASSIAAEIGDLTRFTTPLKWDPSQKCERPRNLRDVEDALAKFAGLWWPDNSSGQFTAEDKPMSKRGNAYLRYFILQAADRMRLSIPSYKTYYDRKYAQATKHKHKRALVLTGRKALGLLVGLLHRHEFYRSEEDPKPSS